MFSSSFKPCPAPPRSLFSSSSCSSPSSSQALERQREISDIVRMERDRLREEVVRLRDLLKVFTAGSFDITSSNRVMPSNMSNHHSFITQTLENTNTPSRLVCVVVLRNVIIVACFHQFFCSEFENFSVSQ